MLRYSLAVTAAVCGVALVVRTWCGPFVYGVSVRSPMNAASVFAAAMVVLLFLSFRGADIRAERVRMPFWAVCIAAGAGTVAAHWPTLRVNFVADDYTHILTVSKADRVWVTSLFTVPALDRFFRPWGMLSYWVDYQWAGFSAMRWHAGALALHAVNAMLVCRCGWRLGLGAGWSLVAALVFGIHGTRPEAVTWIAARFDLLATLFVLLALLLFVSYCDRRSRAALLLMLLATLAALLSKESAYVLPLLLALVASHRGDWRARHVALALGACFAMTCVAFAYRWWLLSGIGGYVDPQGAPTIFLPKLWLFLKALCLRLWAVLVVPLNWTGAPGSAVKITLPLAAAALMAVAWRARRTPLVTLGVLVTLIAALPVYHLLLIGPDLEKSRVVYLGSAGFALALAAALSSCPRRLAVPAAAAFLCFQVAALRHNLAIWQRMSDLHARTCDQLAAAAAESEIVAVGLPNTVDGIYMLKTGAAECIEMRRGVPRSRLHPVDTLKEAQEFPRARVFVWDEKERRLVADRSLTVAAQ